MIVYSRGYVYDVETGLYYLRSRYYSWNWQRFLNADTVYSSNLFSYCHNEPIYNIDIDGFSDFPVALNKKKMDNWRMENWNRLNLKYNTGHEGNHCAAFVSEILAEGGYPKDASSWDCDIIGLWRISKNNSTDAWNKSYKLYEKLINDGWSSVVIYTEDELAKAVEEGTVNDFAVAFMFDNVHRNQPWHVVSIYINVNKQVFYYGHTTNRDGRNPVQGHRGLVDSIDPEKNMYVEVFRIVD